MKKVMGIGHGVIYLYDLSVNHRITMRVDHPLDQLQEWFDVPVFDTPDKAEKNFLKNSFSAESGVSNTGTSNHSCN